MISLPLCKSLGRPLPTPAEMAEWDALSMNEFLIPEVVLMENASREALHVISALLPPQRRILIIMGGGNNGGDGACLARHLLDAGHSVLVCHSRPLDTLPSAAREHARIARKTGVPFTPLSFEHDAPVTPPEYRAIARSPHVVIDALLGTGFTGMLREMELAAVRFMNAMGESVPVISIDIPSGLDGLTGTPRPEAVRAAHTVTFEAAKPGLVMPGVEKFTGELHVRRIGIPSAVQEFRPASFYLLAPQATAWPANKPDMHKGQAGACSFSAAARGSPAHRHWPRSARCTPERGW